MPKLNHPAKKDHPWKKLKFGKLDNKFHPIGYCVWCGLPCDLPHADDCPGK